MTWLSITTVIISISLSACTATNKLSSEVEFVMFESGKLTYLKNCALCHAENLRGTDIGPPLIWDLYVASHHSDRQFRKAITQGVAQHHWPYGDMPAFSNLTKSEVNNVVHFVRSTLRQNGIR